MIDLNIHLLLFTAAGITLLLAPLVIGRFLRPTLPTPEKDAVYECGEPTIGSSYIQFDLRFYVVALLFIIFDVEVAFFFPWAVVFGGARQLADTRLTTSTREVLTDRLLDLPAGTTTADTVMTAQDAMQMATIGMFDIFVFFGVLLVGFAYVWKRGDLDWVRSLVNQARAARGLPERNAA
ncbi:MAG TPA: NADH-quinone oxidoreductase subunit A [Caulifigura sp.]|jgi:NADH-quinone oxidoreductase subunit A|nr:NADH-quinone oxidoreductase subunit A [Caulifigura sp.]